VTTFDAPRAAGRPQGRGALFDERGFAWPELPGNPKREAKLPWFHFHDVDEARDYLGILGAETVLGTLLFVNWLFFKNDWIAWGLFPVLLAVQVVHHRMWVGLCKRARPQLGRWHWWMTGAFSPQRWQCVSQARSMLRDR